MSAEQSAPQSDDRVLSNAERNRILDQAIRARNRPVISGMSFLVLHEPQIVVDRSNCSAVMTWGKTLTSPIVIVLMTVLGWVTCGLYFFIWFVMTLRRNRFVQTIDIDEHGLEHWGLAPIPQSQRILSVAIVFMAIFFYTFAMHQANSM